MPHVNSLSRMRLTEAERKLSLVVTEDGRVYEYCSARAGNGFASVRLLRKTGAPTAESLPFLPRRGSRGSIVLPSQQGRPQGSAARLDVHASGRSDLLFCRRPQPFYASFPAQSLDNCLFGSRGVSRGVGNEPLWGFSANPILRAAIHREAAKLHFTYRPFVGIRISNEFSAEPNKSKV